MKGTFTHRRNMTYFALVGLFYCAYGVVHLGIKDGAIGGLAVAFSGIVIAYFTNATYDDHSERKHKND